MNLVCTWEFNRLSDPLTVTVDPAQPKVRIYLERQQAYRSILITKFYQEFKRVS